MEHYAHSLSKKNAFGSATHHKSVYDDVFGGPPKFGGPTLAPRYEDYGEIFSGFHSSSRGLSIPILDLPINLDEAEASFDDVRSAWFDYSEVFGGLHDNDFAVSFEDLVRRFEAVDYSSDDAWSPVQSGSFSDELDPSVCSTNADSSSSYIPAEYTKFHTSYYKTNQRTSGEIAVDVPEEPHLNDISGHGSCIGKSHVLQEQIEPPETVDSGGDQETDDCDSEKTIKSFAQNSKSFVTINDISLRTKPSRIPPPSRPPPLFAVKKGTFGKADSSLNDSYTCGFERGEGSHSPPFYDVEVDVNNTTYCRANSSMDDVTRGTHATEGIIGIHSSSEEETTVTEGRSTVFDKEKCGNKLPHKFKGTFAWRQETEYFEVVGTDLPSVAVVHDKDGYISFPYRSNEYCNQGGKPGTESSDLRNIEPSMVARKDDNRDGEKNEQECLQETRIAADHIRQSVATVESSRVKDCQKKSSLDDSCEIVENAVKARVTVAENEDGLNLWGTNADEIVMNIHEQKANARRRWKSFETESYHEISDKDVEQIVKEKPVDRHEKRLNQNHEKGEKEKNPKKSCDGKKYDENIKEANPYSKIDSKNRQSKMVLNLDKNEDHIEMAPVEFYEENDTHVADVSLSAVTMENWDENTIRLSFDKNNIEGSSRVGDAPMVRNEDAINHVALDQGTRIYMKVSNSEVPDSVNEEMHETILPQKLDKTRLRNLESTPASISNAEDENMETIFQTNDLKLEEKSSDFAVEEDCGKTKMDLQPDKLETSTEASCSNQRVTDSKQTAIGTSSTENDVKSAPITHDPVRLDNNEEQGEKIIKGVRLNVHKENAKNEHRSYQTSEVASSEKGSKNAEREERCANELLASEKRMRELRLQKEREFENEKLRKLEEEREREREREKDRMAIDSSVTYGRQRTVSTRERSEKDSMEFRERYVAEKASMEARLRAERAAVERATAEARQRAFAKTMSEKPTVDMSERIERSVSDKFSSSSRIAEARQYSESQKFPPASMLRYSYSSLDSGVESESPQRHKARLERYRRTAERAAKALAEKNTRDLIAQKELAERCRLAEYLDVEVKRWSSGKEGNLRALLSTLQYILGPDSGWQPIPLTEVITTPAVKRAYRKATLCVHPDKLQQRGASIQHKYTCEKVFDLLQEAWKTFTSEER